MMSRCLVRGCRSDPGRTDSSVTFHPFPAERAAAERWARLCGVSDQECSQLLRDLDHGGTGRYRLCSLHFEEEAFEGNTDNETCNVKLRPGAEPTLLLSPAPTVHNSDQVNSSSPAGPQRQTPPSASSSCTCGQSQPQTSKAAQGPGCGKSSRTESRPQVSHCPSGATVVSPQPGVSQIVLNFSEEEKGLTLEDVSAERSARCPGGHCCRCPQRVVKQVVLIFLDRPRGSHTPTSSPSSQESSPTTSSSGTQTDGRDGKPKSDSPIQPDRAVHHPSSPQQTSHQNAVHAGTQTEEPGTCVEVSGVQGSPEDMESTPSTGEVPTSPGERACTPRGSCDPDRQTPESIQEPMQAVTCSPQSNVTRRQDDVTPPTPDKVQPPPESLDQESQHGSRVAPSAAADSQAQDDDRTPGDLRRCDRRAEPPPCPHCRPTCRPLCLDPSINQYVGDLLEQYNVAPPPCISASSSAECTCISASSSAECSCISASSAECSCISASSSAGCSCISASSSAGCSCISASSSAECPCVSSQRRVKQIVVNIVEQQRAALSQDVSAPCTASESSSSPGVASQQHQETQTCDDFLRRTLRRPKEKPKSLPSRPPKSQSCPPLIVTTAELSLSQEEEDIPAHAMTDGGLRQDMGSSLESKVTFEDVAVYFSKEEWELLGSSEKDLYREVMSDNYRALLSLGLLQEKPDLVLRMENEEENLWVIQESHRRIRHREEDLHFLESDTDGVRVLAKDEDASSSCAGRESVESSSHLGALMRLVNEIPGFLLGSSVTDESCSPARSAEDHGSSRTFLEVKTEEHSPACSPASSHLPLSETPEITAGLGAHRITEQRNSKIVTKVEKKGAVSQSPGYSTTVSHLPVSLSCVKSDPGGGHDSVPSRLHIKQEEFCAHPLMGRQRETPAMKPVIAHLPHTPLYGPGPREHPIPDYARRPPSGGGTSMRRSAGASPRNSSVSPASASPGANCTGPGDLKIKIKQEDSGSEREMAESPVYGRKAHHSPASSFSSSLQAEREHWRLAASPLRSPTDVPPGSSPLHRLVNCLKEISGGRPRPYSSALSTTRWGLDMSRVCADSSVRANREPPAPAPQPNPFTVAVTNGAAQLRESQSMRAGRDDLHASNVPLSALGKCLEKIHSRVSGGQNIGAPPNTAELGVKRTHSEDLSGRPGVYAGAKRPALEASSCSRVVSSCSPGHRDLWRPPEELPQAPGEDQPIGNSHLMSVMNCVRKIPGFRPSPSIQVTSMPDGVRTCAQGVITETKGIKVKQEKDDNPPPLPHPPEASKQWLPPPQSPDASKQSGPTANNVHLSGLMKLMEEIPCTDASSSSRAMYSIAVGHSLARRLDRSNFLSCNDDPGFQADLNDSTIASVASVDSVYSDDTTSWSSENVGPSYSAIGGLQRVVSEFAELVSVSPLVAVAAPPVSSVQDGIGLKKPKEASSVSAASTPRLMESVRRSPREAVGVSSSACSAENGEAAFAALRGLQKVVHGFVEQECVSPMSAVRNSTPTGGLRDCPVRKTCAEEEAASPHPPASSPAPLSRFLCDAGKWLPEPDSSYSALSGLQKVVNGFSEMSCVSPFSAVSTPVSDGTAEGSVQRRSDTQAPDCVSSPLTGQKNVINGVPDIGCLSPLTVASNMSSESDATPAAKRRCERRDDGHDMSEHSRSSSSSRAPSSHCIDLTQEEEATCGKNKERRPKTREGPPLSRNKELPSNRSENPRARPSGSSSQTPCNQLIDLTEEDEALTRPKVSHSEPARKSSHTGLGHNPPLPEKHRPSLNLPKAPSGRLDKPLDPGASGSSRGAVPAVNEHLSGLEKLLKGVPTFTPANRPSEQQAWSGGWWFRSTSPHET